MARLFTKEEESAWWNQIRNHPGMSLYHVYTKPPENGIVIADRESLDVTISYMALAAKETSVAILAYAVMSNHFHWLIRGKEISISLFFRRFRRLLDVYLSRHGKGKTIRLLFVDQKEITSLKQFRDEVAYILRNPYVARSDVNIMSNPWTSSFLYFNPLLPLLPAVPASQLTKTQKRRLLFSSTLMLPKSFVVSDGKVAPLSFVDYRTVEALFHNARKFTVWLLKNVEAQVEIATQYGEPAKLPDEELSPIIWKYCKDRFGSSETRFLQPTQIQDLLREFKFNYNASNAQMARLTDIPLKTIDALFPPMQ